MVITINVIKIFNKIRGTDRDELKHKKKHCKLFTDKNINIDNVDKISNELENDINVKYHGLTSVLSFNKRYEHWKIEIILIRLLKYYIMIKYIYFQSSEFIHLFSNCFKTILNYQLQLQQFEARK